jgi:hypothetical protein
MADWHPEIQVEGAVTLPAEPRTLEALGRNHSIQTALADLVDNSIDAGATRVLIRFIQHGAQLRSLYVIDNGKGMPPDGIDTAMTLGGRRTYATGELGHFGMGLKAASFSQAATLGVFSRAAGHSAVGRRWSLATGIRNFRCDVVPEGFSASELDRTWHLDLSNSGTVIRWDNVGAFPAASNEARTEEYLHGAISQIQSHLGLTFHRLIKQIGIDISIDVEHVDGEDTGLVHKVTALDPFGYAESLPGWPRTLTSQAASGRRLALHCHIWPKASQTPEYRLPGGADRRQGLYFYRAGRLIQAGGWDGVHVGDQKLQLARVAIDIEALEADFFTINPEKSRVTVNPAFAEAIGVARATDGTTVPMYLESAEAAWIESRRRTSGRREPVLPPGSGIHTKVAREIRNELPQLNEDELSIKWKRLSGEDFFEVDRANQTLWLNQRYRRALLNGRHGGLNDLPVMKALLFLLVGEVFKGQHLGPRDKDNIELWQEILTAASRVEKANFDG